MFSQLIIFLSAVLLLNGAMAQSNSVSTTTLLNHIQSTAVAYVTMTGTPPATLASESSSSVVSTTESTSLPAASNTTLVASTTAQPTQGGNSTNGTTSTPGSPTLAPHGGAGSTIGVSSGLMAALIGFVVLLN